jgi:hypothetical protein
MKIWILCFTLFLFGCENTPSEQLEYNKRELIHIEKYEIPPGSTDVEYQGNGWIIFKWHNMKFLYQYHNGGYSVMQRID